MSKLAAEIRATPDSREGRALVLIAIVVGQASGVAVAALSDIEDPLTPRAIRARWLELAPLLAENLSGTVACELWRQVAIASLSTRPDVAYAAILRAIEIESERDDLIALAEQIVGRRSARARVEARRSLEAVRAARSLDEFDAASARGSDMSPSDAPDGTDGEPVAPGRRIRASAH